MNCKCNTISKHFWITFHVENIYHFVVLHTKSYKKKLMQDASDREKKKDPGASFCRHSDTGSVDDADSRSCLPCLKHLTVAGGEEEGVMVDVERGLRGVHCVSSARPVPLLQSTNMLLFGT